MQGCPSAGPHQQRQDSEAVGEGQRGRVTPVGNSGLPEGPRTTAGAYNPPSPPLAQTLGVQLVLR